MAVRPDLGLEASRQPDLVDGDLLERGLGRRQPNGLAVKDGALYVFAIHRVLRYDNIEDKLDNPGEPVDLTDKFGLPPEIHHNWKYAAFGPDGKLYTQVGANCNICEINPGVHGQIRRYNTDGSGMEVVARGVRNTVGFDWHPVTKELWFTDNGRDWGGDDGPQDELNRIRKGQEGANFGFPYCHANGIPDPDIRIPNPCAGVVMPAALTGPHSAGLGIIFYTGKMFPKTYQNVAFIARRGLMEPGKEVRLRCGGGADPNERNGQSCSRLRPGYSKSRRLPASPPAHSGTNSSSRQMAISRSVTEIRIESRASYHRLPLAL
jgi:glucose/arabinose dehydrogenase